MGDKNDADDNVEDQGTEDQVIDQLDEKKKGEKRKLKLKAETGKLVREFSDVTTLHGIRYVGERDASRWERWCWVIAIIICAIFCGLEISKLWNKWQNSPIIISFENKPRFSKNIALPALTICPENKVKKSLVDVDKNYSQIVRQLKGELEYESDKQKLQVEAISMVCQYRNESMWISETPFVNNATLTTQHARVIRDEISPTLDDILESCSLNGVEFECDKLFRPILLTHALCFTFNTMDNRHLYTSIVDQYPLKSHNLNTCKQEWDPELGFLKNESEFCEYPFRSNSLIITDAGLKFTLISRPEDNQQMCSLQDPDAFRISIQSPYQTPDVTFFQYVFITPGTDTILSVKPNIVTAAPEIRKYHPNIRECKFYDDDKLKFFRLYTRRNCIQDCALNLVREYCDCQQYFQPAIKSDNISHCTLEMMESGSCSSKMRSVFEDFFYHNPEKEFGLAGMCNCLPGCSEIQYDFDVAPNRFNSNKKGGSILANRSYVQMYYESEQFYGKHRSELYGVTDFIASCGGLLGLFTGFSLISAIEIFYFATLRLACKLKRRREDDVSDDDSANEMNSLNETF